MGTGNSSGRAQRAAEDAERARQAEIKSGTGRVNAAFDAPERMKQYEDYLNAIRTQYMDDATRQKTIADRRSKFALARNGLTGGSADVDTRRRLGEEFSTGVLRSEQLAQGSASQLRAQDEGARNQLLQMIQGGLDSTTAAQRAGSALQQSAQQMKAGALTDSLGDIFGSTAGVYKQQEDNAARRRAAKDTEGAIYARSPFG